MSDAPWIADETLDLHGIECPYTFVHAKLVLEEMQPGERLCIVIDHAPARKTLPASIAYEGHLVLAEIPRGSDVWEIWVECRDVQSSNG